MSMVLRAIYTCTLGDWLLDTLEPLHLENAMLRSFLVNRKFVLQNAQQYRTVLSGQTEEEAALRLDYIKYFKKYNRYKEFAMFLVSPIRRTPEPEMVREISVQILNSRSPYDFVPSAVYEAIADFFLEPDITAWIEKDQLRNDQETQPDSTVPVRMIVFEVPPLCECKLTGGLLCDHKLNWLMRFLNEVVMWSGRYGVSEITCSLYMMKKTAARTIGVQFVARLADHVLELNGYAHKSNPLPKGDMKQRKFRSEDDEAH